MSDTDSMSVPEAEVLQAARKKVMETNELLELILTFLPAKKIFGILTVSKCWNSVITNSAQLQQKMFLRLSNKPHEFWTVDAKHKPGANRFTFKFAQHLNDTELKFRRVDSLPDMNMPVGKPITLNPVLHYNYRISYNAMSVYLRGTPGSLIGLHYGAWIDPNQHDESLWKTYLMDPPCHEAEVPIFAIFFGSYDAETGTWTAPDIPDDVEERDNLWWGEGPTRTEISFDEGDTLVKSDEPLTLGHLLKPAFETRAQAYCRSPVDPDHYNELATMYETFDVLKTQLGAKSLPRRAYMRMTIKVERGEGKPHMILPTDEERAQAYTEWKPRKRG